MKTFTSKICSKHITKTKKGEQVSSWRWTRNSHLKFWKKSGKGLSWDVKGGGTVGNCQQFSGLYYKFHKGFKEKDAFKNVWDGVATVLESIQTVYFNFNSFIAFFETILFIWFNPLVPRVPSLYPQYHLILYFTVFYILMFYIVILVSWDFKCFKWGWYYILSRI